MNTVKTLTGICIAVVLALSPILVFATGGGISFDSQTMVITKVVGEEVELTLTARDKNSNIIRGWNTVGTDITLTVKGSTAENDNNPKTVTKIFDINHNLLTSTGPDTWILPRDVFVDGVTKIYFTSTKTDTMITIEAVPGAPSGKNVSEPMTFIAGAVQNFLMEVIPHLAPKTVYVLRKYEIRVTPRDEYDNVNADEEVITKFSARFPGEYTDRGLGSANIFAGNHFIKGTVTFFLISTMVRTDQEIIAYKSSDPNVRGTTGQYIIAEHAPYAFSLISPPDKDTIFIDYAAQQFDLTWEKKTPPDPFTNISVGGQILSDDVRYEVVFSTPFGSPFLNLASNASSTEAKLTLSGSQMVDLITKATGLSNSAQAEVLWHANATDGLFTTRSNEQWTLVIMKRGITDVPASETPLSFALEQNYPNPFNPATTIRFSISRSTYVTLKVYNLLGKEVAVLLSDVIDAGTHTIKFNASRLKSGLYIYKLTAGNKSAVRTMTLLK